MNRGTKQLAGLAARHPWAVFLLWAAACSFVYWAFGSHSYIRIPDNADSTLASKLGIAHSMASYGITRWWTLALSGGGLLPQGVAGSLDTLLFLALPGWLAYGLLMLLQRWIAGLFLYKLLRETLSLRASAALYAGMAYALFAQSWLNASWEGFTTYDGFAVPGLPLVIWGISAVVRSADSRRYVYAALLGALYAVSGSVVFTFFLWLITVAWLVYVERLPLRSLWKPLFVALAVYGAIAVPLNAPTMMHAPHSYRADWTLGAQWYGWGFHVRLLKNIIASNVLSLLLIVAGVAAGGWKKPLFRRAVLMLAGVYALVGLKPVYAWLAAEVLGFLNGVAFERVYLGLPFLFIAAGALGLHAVTERFEVRRWVRDAIPALAIAVVLFQYAGQTKHILTWMVRGSNYAAAFEQPQVMRLAERTREAPPFRVATVMAHRYLQSGRFGLIPQYNAAFAWAAGLETSDGYVLIYPQWYQDYWMRVMAPLYTRRPDMKHSFAVRGNRVELFLTSDMYYDPEAVVPFAENFDLDALSALNVRYIISNFRLDDARLTLVSDGGKYLHERTRTGSTAALLRDYVRGHHLQIPVYIYENPESRPRLYLQPDAASSVVRIIKYSPDRVRVQISAEKPGVLVHSATWEAGWTAHVNGKLVPVERFCGTLQSVAVPEGTSDVVLKYTGW